MWEITGYIVAVSIVCSAIVTALLVWSIADKPLKRLSSWIGHLIAGISTLLVLLVFLAIVLISAGCTYEIQPRVETLNITLDMCVVPQRD